MKQERYLANDIENKWQARWLEANLFASTDFSAPKYYLLEMFPYPSGKIHMGHVRNYSIGDALARFKRMQGFNVLHPMGWDAFGLPAENAAIKNKTHPAAWTMDNIASMRQQIQRLGFAYDWQREVATCHPEYYRWEQQFFLKLYDKGLIYRKKAAQNWCPSCQTVLANEQVINGHCWRCDSKIEQKELAQWFLKITAYADELLRDLELLEGFWPDRVIAMQKHWIGKSFGTKIRFALEKTVTLDGKEITDLEVFTTRPDTLFGATFVTLAPDHPLVEALPIPAELKADILAFVNKVKDIDRIERQSENLEKEGIFTGCYVIHPFTKEHLPLWLGNFVLADYGSGAVMAVPAHDYRDFAFAKKYNLPLKIVVQASDPATAITSVDALQDAYTESGILVNSGNFSGMDNEKAKEAISKALEEIKAGQISTQFRLRDWNISRQRYWGAPIPMITCPNCGIVKEKEENLPVKLPLNAQIPDDGRSPLSTLAEFVDCTCPVCGAKAKRETDTLDTFVESSWYYARYTSARKADAAFDPKILEFWLPVDQYIGGVEHAILHLLYSRFFTKVLRDLGFYPKNLAEPFKRLLTQGMVLKDSLKMSKSKGNIVSPEEMIDRYGADTVRLFCLFAAPPERDFDWSDSGIEGSFRFLQRVWRLFFDAQAKLLPVKACSASIDLAKSDQEKELLRKEHATVKKVSEDIEKNCQFNTAIAAIMELVNSLYTAQQSEIKQEIFASAMATVLTLISPFAPHLADELWEQMGHKTFLLNEAWPKWSEDALVEQSFSIALQVNGRVRGNMQIAADLDQKTLEDLVSKDSQILRYLEGKTIQKIIIVPGKLVNVVAK